MKRNNQRGAQRQPTLQAQAKNNRSLMGVVKHILSGAAHSMAEVFDHKPPRNLHNRSKYKPHQGEQHKARILRTKDIYPGGFMHKPMTRKEKATMIGIIATQEV